MRLLFKISALWSFSLILLASCGSPNRFHQLDDFTSQERMHLSKYLADNGDQVYVAFQLEASYNSAKEDLFLSEAGERLKAEEFRSAKLSFPESYQIEKVEVLTCCGGLLEGVEVRKLSPSNFIVHKMKSFNDKFAFRVTRINGDIVDFLPAKSTLSKNLVLNWPAGAPKAGRWQDLQLNLSNMAAGETVTEVVDFTFKVNMSCCGTAAKISPVSGIDSSEGLRAYQIRFFKSGTWNFAISARVNGVLREYEEAVVVE